MPIAIYGPAPKKKFDSEDASGRFIATFTGTSVITQKSAINKT